MRQATSLLLPVSASSTFLTTRTRAYEFSYLSRQCRHKLPKAEGCDRGADAFGDVQRFGNGVDQNIRTSAAALLNQRTVTADKIITKINDITNRIPTRLFMRLAVPFLFSPFFLICFRDFREEKKRENEAFDWTEGRPRNKDRGRRIDILLPLLIKFFVVFRGVKKAMI